MEPDGWTLWLALAAAGGVGYFLVSKMIDFFRHGSSWNEGRSSPPDDSMTASSIEEKMQEDQSRFNSNKPIG